MTAVSLRQGRRRCEAVFNSDKQRERIVREHSVCFRHNGESWRQVSILSLYLSGEHDAIIGQSVVHHIGGHAYGHMCLLGSGFHTQND